MSTILEHRMYPCITLIQPWASFVAMGWKTIETRTHAHFAGLVGHTIGIHAGLKFDQGTVYSAGAYLTANNIQWLREHQDEEIPHGQLIALATVEAAHWLVPGDAQRALIECETHRFGIFLRNILPIKPINVKGHQGIWRWTGKVEVL